MKFIVVFIFSVVNLLAIITIAPVVIGSKPGASGMLKGSFETKRGNTDVDNYSAGFRAQYDNNTSYVLWSDFVFSYGKASGETNTNKSYAHLRLVHTFLDSKVFNYETFVQSEKNEFTSVKEKILLGGDFRYYQDLSKYGDFYVGLGSFYETVEYLTNLNPDEENFRINFYVSYTKSFSKDSKFTYVMYFQPNIAEPTDYVLSNATELEILIYEKLYLDFVIYYDQDTKPAVGVEKSDFTQKTSFIYKF